MTLIRQIKGVIPALDRRQPVDKFVLTGRNFLVDAEGPFAAFSSELITVSQIRNPEAAETFRVGNEIFLFTADAVLQFDANSELYYPIFTFPLNNTAFPWSQATVGGVHYFVKQNSNIFRYNPFTDTWTTVTAGVITTPHAVTRAGGRLVVLGVNDVQWSAIDDGTDLATDIEKGIGIQSLAIVGGGNPLAVLPTFDGFITYTSTGSMKSELVDAINPFRHFPLTGDAGLIPISPYTVIEVANNEHVFLSKVGFHITTGKVPEPFQALMSEFFRRQILPLFDLTNPTLIRLTFNTDRQWFIVSLAESEQAFNYTIAYVLYLPRDEWGLFNRSHVGFGELLLNVGPFGGFNFGFFCASGCLHRFIDFPHIQAHPDGEAGVKLPTNFHHFHENFTPPARSEDGVIIFTSLVQLETFDETVFTVIGTDLYEFTEINSFPSPATPDDISQDSTLTSFINDLSMQSSLLEMGWRQVTPNFVSIDSFIDVGLFRVNTQEDKVDEFSLVTDVIIGMLDSPTGQVLEDWLTFTPGIEEDWLNDDLVNEDWGVGIFSGTVYTASIIGSLDGYVQYQDQFSILEERTDIVDDELDETTGRARYFTSYNNGTYHIIRIEALQLDESFHLKTIDITPVSAGRV